MAEPAAKKQGYFSPIESESDALRVLKESRNGFFVLAALTAAVAVLLGQYWNLLDAALLAGLGLVVLKTRSQAAAIALMLLTSLQAVMTLLNKLGVTSSGGGNLILAGIACFAAFRAIQATRWLKKASAASAPGTAVGA